MGQWVTVAEFSSMEEMEAYSSTQEVAPGTPVRTVMTFSTPVGAIFDAPLAEWYVQQQIGNNLEVIDCYSPSNNVGVIEAVVTGTPLHIIAGGIVLGVLAIAATVLLFLIVAKLEVWMEKAVPLFQWGALIVGIIGVTAIALTWPKRKKNG